MWFPAELLCDYWVHDCYAYEATKSVGHYWSSSCPDVDLIPRRIFSFQFLRSNVCHDGVDKNTDWRVGIACT